MNEMVEVISEASDWRKQPVAVSAALITYNHEAFIRLALESILAQTYPLDLVISDDCSTDQTVAVMEAALCNYSGPHRIRLRRGKRNLGVCRNQNATLGLTEGELIVLFEGDDISIPDRVAQLVQNYRAREGRVGALGSGIRKIDRQGTLGEEVSWPTTSGDAWTMVRSEWNVHGCGLAIRRDCFFEVGLINRHLISGDITLWMRGAFVQEGGLAQVPNALVLYRLHGDNVSSRVRLGFESPEFLQECCRQLLKNEIAHSMATTCQR